MTRYDLFLGRQTPIGAVSESQFDAFLRTDVDGRLDGYTVIEAKGYWHGAREDSWDLMVIGDAATREPVNAIAQAYARAFSQDAVDVTASPIEAALIGAEPEPVPQAA